MGKARGSSRSTAVVPDSNFGSPPPGSLQDNTLRDAVRKHGKDNWKRVADVFGDRTDLQCLSRYQKVINPTAVKGPWTKEVHKFELKRFLVFLIWSAT